MEPAAGEASWQEFHKRAAALELPQLPDAAIARRCAELIAGNDRRILLLGVTRVLAGLGRDLTAVDFSPTQIERSWPGDRADRRAVLADWREMEMPRASFTAAIGDGCLSTLAWPDDYRNVLGRVAECLEPGGRVALRCYIAPDEREAPDEVVADVLSGRERGWSATLWRLAMSLADDNGAVPARELAAAFRRAFPDLRALAGHTGWNAEGIDLVLGSFARAGFAFSFVTGEAVLATLPATLADARFVPSGDYPLAERCPYLVAERTA